MKITQKVFKTAKKSFSPEPRYVYFGKIEQDGRVIDTALLTYFKAPASYTGEDVCEISCHGGIKVTEQVLITILSAGARMALPGEFTKRAFINGKLLLDEAEAVGEIINADSDACLKAAASNLVSGAGKALSEEKETLKDILARFFAVIDWPDEEIEEDDFNSLSAKLLKVKESFTELLSTAKSGRIIKNGVKTAIIGKPNAGKSTLMNALADYERSIVTSIPGTTRDVVNETVSIGGIKLEISDTAGIRSSDDEIEKIGIEKAFSELEKAELVIYTVDTTSKIDEEEIKLAAKIKAEKKPTVAVFTKQDLSEITLTEAKEILKELGLNCKYAVISAKNRKGLEALSKEIEKITGVNEITEGKPVLLNERQIGCLIKANEAVDAAIELIKEREMPDKIAEELTAAIEAVSSLDGTKADEEILKTIFSKFCVGK